MANTRQKGQIFAREVRRILEGANHVVDGPFYASKWFNGKINAVHTDIFNCFDLCSFFEGNYYFHQISIISEKSRKIKLLQEKALPGWVWCRVSNGRVFYRIFIVKPGEEIEEAEIRWKV